VFYHHEYHPNVKSLRYPYFLLHKEGTCLAGFCFSFAYKILLFSFSGAKHVRKGSPLPDWFYFFWDQDQMLINMEAVLVLAKHA